MTGPSAEPTFSRIKDPCLRQMAEEHFDMLRETVEESTEQIIPILLLEVGDDVRDPDGEVIPKGSLVPVAIADDIKKDRRLAYTMLALLVSQLKAVRAVWGGEAWMVMAGPKGEMPQMPLSEHPERIDSLIVVAFDADRVYGASFPILHTDDGRRVSRPVEAPEGEWGGMITDFLQPALVRP